MHRYFWVINVVLAFTYVCIVIRYWFNSFIYIYIKLSLSNGFNIIHGLIK